MNVGDVALIVALVATAAGVALFVRGIAAIVAMVRQGAPAPGRTRPVGRRLLAVVREALSHTRFAGRPGVRIAHWCVMISFPLLVFTLLAGYGQLRDASYALPLLGHLWPWEWLTEFFAWAGLLGIVGLTALRIISRPRATRSTTVPDAAASPASPATPAPLGRTGSSQAPMQAPGTHESARVRGADHASAGTTAPATADSTAPGTTPPAAADSTPPSTTPTTAASSTAPGTTPPVPLAGTAGAAPARTTAPGPQTGPAAAISLPRPLSRFVYSRMGAGYFVEFTVAAVLVCVLVLRGLEFAVLAQDPTQAALATPLHFPLTAWLGQAWSGASASGLATAITVVALVKIVVSMSWFVVVGLAPSMGVAWHRFLALVTIYTRRDPAGKPALGPLEPLHVGAADLDVRELEDLPEDASLGAGVITDLTWKNLLDVAACTECGRCQEACPAWRTGKILSPKRLVIDLRDHAYAVAGGAEQLPLVGGALPGAKGGLTDQERQAARAGERGSAQDRGYIMEAEALWDCTMCGACVQACPVDIEHLDILASLRRHQSLMEGRVPKDLGGALRKMEQRGNPWGMPARARMDWAKPLDFPVPVLGEDVSSAAEVDYLFWVGCAGAFDERAQETTRAVSTLLHLAGVSFAVLGAAEQCTGDAARRAGNEVEYQTLALGNIEAFTEFGVTRIIATCPHCFTTLGQEYPQLGGRYQVFHHTQVLDRLVREGRLHPQAPTDGQLQPVTFHDPCFLGRQNGTYDEPRSLLTASGIPVVEMADNRATSMCCGAGGARAWQEERVGTRIADARAAQAVDAGAGTIATGCPFCSVMLRDASVPTPDAVTPPVRDVAVLLLEACTR